MTVEPPAWRFSNAVLSVDERFGYRGQLWPHARTVIPLKPGMRVLDVGCGGGAFSRFAAWAMENRGTIVGLDRDEELLANARAGLPSTKELAVDFRPGDAKNLGFPSASFDAAISGFLLCVIPSPEEALREMRRVTKPGGIVASLSCFCKSGIFPRFEGLHAFDGNERLHELWLRFSEARRIRIRNPALGLPNGKDLDVWGAYAKVGLTDLHIYGYLTVFAPSDARWSDPEAREFVVERRRIELATVDDLTRDQRATLEKAGFSAKELEELRSLLASKYDWLLADPLRIRSGMEMLSEPAVLITGRVPE